MTTFLDPRVEVALHDLLARGFQLVLLIISPAQAMPERRRSSDQEATARLWRVEIDLRLLEFRRLGVPVIIQDADDPLSSLCLAVSGGRVWPRAR
jgi:hypothetical protein